MESKLPPFQSFPLFCLIITFSTSLAASLFLWMKKNLFKIKKQEESKALLKELLEGFGLEVPSELESAEVQVMNSKSPADL